MAKRLVRFDWAMKTLLRDKANFDILEGFLSALLEDDSIKILNFLESETTPKDENDKFIRVDLLLQDSQNRKIYIEIQNTREKDYLESLLYASSKIIVENQKLGNDFSDISKVISISILYFNLGLGDDYLYYGTTNFTGMNSGKPLLIRSKEEIPSVFEPKYVLKEKQIFPEYYLITVDRYKNIIRKKVDEWIYIFKNSEVAEGSVSKNIDKAEKKLAEMNMTETERKQYEKYMINWVRDKDAFNTSIQEATEKGEKIGIEKGIEKGELRGKIESGLVMLEKGMDTKLIQEILKLSDTQMKILKKVEK